MKDKANVRVAKGSAVYLDISGLFMFVVGFSSPSLTTRVVVCLVVQKFVCITMVHRPPLA